MPSSSIAYAYQFMAYQLNILYIFCWIIYSYHLHHLHLLYLSSLLSVSFQNPAGSVGEWASPLSSVLSLSIPRGYIPVLNCPPSTFFYTFYSSIYVFVYLLVFFFLSLFHVLFLTFYIYFSFQLTSDLCILSKLNCSYNNFLILLPYPSL